MTTTCGGKGLWYPLVTFHYWGKSGQSSSRQGLYSETKEEATEEHCLLPCFPWFAQLLFLYSPVPPSLEWDHPNHSFMEKMIPRAIGWNKFINPDLFYPVMSRFPSIWQQITSTSSYFYHNFVMKTDGIFLKLNFSIDFG